MPIIRGRYFAVGEFIPPVFIEQQITFELPPEIWIGESPYMLDAAADSGLPVVYTSSNTGVAAIEGNLVVFHSLGSAIITASQGGGVGYFPAPSVQQNFEVVKKAQTITFNEVPGKTMVDAPFLLVAVSDSSLPVTFTSNDPAVVSISGNTATIHGAGTVQITASQAGNGAYYPAAPVTRAVTVAAIDNSPVITLRIPLTGVSTPSYKIAPLKYNKKTGFMCVKDDGHSGDYSHVAAYLHGGYPDHENETHPGIRYTDGTLNALDNEVEIQPTFAITTREAKDVESDDPQNGLTSWAQYNAMKAWYPTPLANHSKTHATTDPGADPVFGVKGAYWQVKKNEQVIWDNTQLRTRCFVIPVSHAGFSESAPYLQEHHVSSTFGESSADGNLANGDIIGYLYGLNVNATDVTAINEARLQKFLHYRNYLNFTAPNVIEFKNFVDQAFSNSVAGKNIVFHFFTHQLDYSIWKELINYIHTHTSNTNSDSAWWPSVQEFYEYEEVKHLSVKSHVYEDGVLTITIDQSDLPDTGVHRDVSLVISGGTIDPEGIEIEGADRYTVNASTGLINVFKRNTQVRSPYTDALLPRILSLVRSGNTIIVTYDRLVTQSVYENPDGKAYEVEDNTFVSAAQGSGNTWVLTFSNTVEASVVDTSKRFSYWMQRGDACDAENSDARVCSYILINLS